MSVYLSDPDVTLYHGDALDVLRSLPDESVDCCITSPPYWGLRDYGAEGQLGLEPTPEEYVSRMVEVFREVRRVLAKHGTCWVNMGDSYMGGGGGNYGTGLSNTHGQHLTNVRNRPDFIERTGLKPKDLCGIPWRLAFALQADGWFLRSDIVWSKPNPMPESVTDRPTKAHEYVFLLSKQPRYWFDQEAVRERAIEVNDLGVLRSKKAADGQGPTDRASIDKRIAAGQDPRAGGAHLNGKRNIRSVWEIATQPFPEAHFATFPEELVRRCLLAGCPEQVCDAILCGKCGQSHPFITAGNVTAYAHDEEVPLAEAVQAELRRVRELLRGQEPVDVLEELRESASPGESTNGADSEYGSSGTDSSPGLHSVEDAGSSERSEGLRAGTSVRHGTAHRAATGTVGEGASSERSQGRQPDRELGDRDALDAPWLRGVPELRNALLRSLTCPGCGAQGYRECGKARERVVERGHNPYPGSSTDHKADGKMSCGAQKHPSGMSAGTIMARRFYESGPNRDLGFTDCGHDAYRPGVVLDPFMGSGTVALVARKHGRRAVGIELNEDYCAMAAKRLGQQSLFAVSA